MLIRGWCLTIAYLLDLRSYLLGDVPIGPENEEQGAEPLEEEDQSQALLPASPGYKRPSLFPLRLVALLLLTGASLLICGLFLLTVPVAVGRKLISLWFGAVKVHELNTAACGLYVGLVAIRIATLMCSWIPRGWNAILSKMKEWLLISCKTLAAAILLLGLIPLLIGLLFDVLIIVPLRVPLNQTPIFYLWQDWAFGVLHTKVICGIAMMGEWRLREILEEVYIFIHRPT